MEDPRDQVERLIKRVNDAHRALAGDNLASRMRTFQKWDSRRYEAWIQRIDFDRVYERVACCPRSELPSLLRSRGTRQCGMVLCAALELLNNMLVHGAREDPLREIAWVRELDRAAIDDRSLCLYAIDQWRKSP